MAGGREIEDETRNQMMQNLFGDQSEEEEEDEEEEEVDSEHDAAVQQPAFHSDEGEGEAEFEGDGETEGQGEIEVESEPEVHDVDPEQADSEGERAQSSPERGISEQKVESGEKDAESEEEGYGQRVVTSRRREVIASESEGSDENQYADNDHEDEEVDQTRTQSRSPMEQDDNEVVRDVFGDSDEEEPDEYPTHNELEQDSHRSPMEEEGGYEKVMRPEDVVPDEDAPYESEEEENLEQKPKEKPVGPPLEIEVPLCRPPGPPDRMNMIKVSNIMGIEPKPFDPKTYVEEDVFVTDESGTKKRIRLEDNIVRWRRTRNSDGTTAYESNARFVEWEDGSLQLLIGNEVLNISVHEAHHDHTHLFLRHGKGILQSQGRLLRKMRFMPSSLSSKSHRLLTALVDSRHKKVYKVKNCITDIDPEKEKEEKEKAEGQTIRANELLHRKREKVNRKYVPPNDKGRQLSPGLLEEASEEDDEHEDYYSSRRSAARNRFEEDMEVEAQAEKRIINAKKAYKNIHRKPSMPAARPSRRPVEEYSESEREESEYESEGEDIEHSPSRRRGEPDLEDEYDEDQEAEDDAGDGNTGSEEEDEGPKHKAKDTGRSSLKRKEIDSDGDSPDRRPPAHRRKAMVYDTDED
ncbi:LOW QUALITY PROTEIN: protein LEO1 homolog [Dioscorea cayenensis subsp. rotundata]|uniref:LOW QUALITY PROTEIN: protein LEO1 homolog n=2 Tax=Magnoliopsida TaxID=3398 RepID=A0AB40AHA5_DIOCR|nr:LOW QUALITY PROTEIN: protein LEO1 homolog [Dioscorea cayenensis subsp. rotundata]